MFKIKRCNNNLLDCVDIGHNTHTYIFKYIKTDLFVLYMTLYFIKTFL